MFQDTHGYIWMCTENGLVAYNGYAFKTYTTEDGLPDNEIFEAKEDAAGRLWLMPFAKELCYIWKGKIYNKDNDPVLRQVKLNAHPSNICFDRWGNTWLTDDVKIILISNKGHVSYISNIGEDKVLLIGGIPLKIDSSGCLIVQNTGNFYRYNHDHFEQILHVPIPSVKNPRHRKTLFFSLNFSPEEFTWTPLPLFKKRYRFDKSIYYNQQELPAIHSFKRLTPDKIGLAMKGGFCFKDLHTGKVLERFLNGYNVSYALIAKDSSLWLGTLGQGVFHFSRSFIRSVPFRKRSTVICFINAGKDSLVCTTDEGMLAQISYAGGKTPALINQILIDRQHEHEQCTYIYRFPDGRWTANLSSMMKLYPAPGKARTDKRVFWVGLCKGSFEEGNDHLLMGTPGYLFRIDKKQFRILDTLLKGRITAVTKINQTVYAGTLAGLYSGSDGTKMTSCFDHMPQLRSHITALAADADSILWIATSKVTLSACCNNRIIATLGHDDGLDCSQIIVLKASDSLLWVGTDNGVYAIRKRSPFKIVRHLSEHDGLNSNQVKCLDVAYGRVWVGTNEGLNYFEERDATALHDDPSFFITAIQNGQKDLLPSGNIQLKDNTLRVDFDLIDHSGISAPQFSYRLNDNKWVKLDNNHLYFPALPYGNFTLSLKAVSANSPEPKMLSLKFYRDYPFYLQWWFLLPIAVLLLVLTAFIMKLFLERIHRKRKEQLFIEQNLLQLEQLALQGQMNSHFIFNCLAAIRQYYNKGDLQKANRFVDVFSVLVRTTFEMVNQTFTTLDKEMKYLEQYLAVEQERFDNSFEFSFHLQTDLAASSIPVPSMILQPFVENAVRHGIRSLPEGTKGRIDISITQQQEFVNIVIEDNGTGRKRAPAKQISWPAASITSTTVNTKRIGILNKLFGNRIVLNIEDVQADKQVAGTRVFLSYPLNIYEL